jgi:cysteine desulfurase/selenocysteine lyase
MMCSEPLMDHFGVSGMLRASLTIYNTLDEVDYFIESLQKVIRMLS